MLLCGADSAGCLPRTHHAHEHGAPGQNPPGRNTSGSHRREGPLSALSPRRRDSFKQGLDKWAAKRPDSEEQRKEAAECLVSAELTGKASVSLSGFKLSRLPAQIEALTKAETLDASRNQLGKLPKEIGSMSRLRLLNLSHNQLSELPASIGLLTQLVELVVDHNRLEKLPDEMQYLSELEVFSAKSNQLSKLPESMRLLLKLRYVDLKGNQIRALPEAWSELFNRLRQVNLSDNMLHGLPESFGRADKRAKTVELHVENNPIASLPIAYGGFHYPKSPGGSLLENAAGNIAVHTEGTEIRQGLVQEGRLAPGHGIFANAAPIPARARQRPAAPGQFDPDCASQCSMRDYIREHGEPGQDAGIKRPQQQAEAEPDLLGGQPEWTKPKTEDWLNQPAATYANRPGAVPLGPQPPQPQYMAGWNAALPHLGAGTLGNGHAVPPPFVAQPQPMQAPNAAPNLVSALFAELLRLPESMQAAVVQQLASVPAPVLMAALARLQDQGGASGALPAGVPTMGVAPTASSLAPQFIPQFPPQSAPQFPSQFTRPGVQQAPTRVPGEAGPSMWESTDHSWSSSPPPWAGARPAEMGMLRADSDRWAPPRWVAPGPSEETEADAGAPEFGTYAWTSPPRNESIQEAEEPGILDMIESMFRPFRD